MLISNAFVTKVTLSQVCQDVTVLNPNSVPIQCLLKNQTSSWIMETGPLRSVIKWSVLTYVFFTDQLTGTNFLTEAEFPQQIIFPCQRRKSAITLTVLHNCPTEMWQWATNQDTDTEAAIIICDLAAVTCLKKKSVNSHTWYAPSEGLSLEGVSTVLL